LWFNERTGGVGAAGELPGDLLDDGLRLGPRRAPRGCGEGVRGVYGKGPTARRGTEGVRIAYCGLTST